LSGPISIPDSVRVDESQSAPVPQEDSSANAAANPSQHGRKVDPPGIGILGDVEFLSIGIYWCIRGKKISRTNRHVRKL
jgi:hypothetical protein